MRVTNMYMVTLAQQANEKNQSTVAQLSQEVSSGLAVSKPSDNPTAWIEAQRAKVEQTINDGTGQALQGGLEKINATDGALSTLSQLVSQAQSLAVEGASASITSDARADAAQQVTGLLQSALAAVNTKDVDGTYLLSGTAVNTAPFDATGTYQGNTATTSVASSGNGTSQDSLAGSALDAGANSVNIIQTLGDLATALSGNDVTGIQAQLANLNTAVSQLATTRAQVGGMMSALQSAQSAQQSLSTTLTTSISGLVDADAVQSASNLAQASTALQVSQAVTSKVLALLQPDSSS
ncbi:MAG TPA: flagellin [Kofleriaceae bacterium]|jgi:flagellar hook-associated protein 3 FlgL